MVRIQGTALPGNINQWRALLLKQIEILEHHPRVPYADLSKLRGVLVSIVKEDPNWVWLVLRNGIKNIRVVARTSDYPVATFQPLLDAEIEVSAVPYVTFGKFGTLVPHFSIRGTDSIRTLNPAPIDPFKAPYFHSFDEPHRQRLRGTVLGMTDDRLQLQTELGHIVTVFPAPAEIHPRPFDQIELSGFISTALAPTFENALLRIIKHETTTSTPAPIKCTSLESLFSSGNNTTIARIRGRVIGRSESNRGLLLLEEGGRTVSLNLHAVKDALVKLPDIGSVLEVVGSVFYDFGGDRNRDIFPFPHSIMISPRNPDEITILIPPPWWTPPRIFAAFILLVMISTVIVLWNRSKLKLRLTERTRLATELHDYLAQNLTAISYRLTAAKLSTKGSALATSEHLEAADRMLASCRTELRRCLYDLRNEALDEPDIARALKITLRPLVQNTNLTITFGSVRPSLREDVIHALLASVRELVSNALHHGHASKIAISGEIRRNRLVVTVRDNGSGFNPINAPGIADGHFGLSGVGERLHRIGATMKITSAPAEGTVITLSIPS